MARLTEPQRRLLAEVEEAGVLYIKRQGTYHRTAQALVRKGALVVSEPDYSIMGQDGYSVPFPTDLQAARDEAAVRIAAFKQSMSHNARSADSPEVAHTDGYPATD